MEFLGYNDFKSVYVNPTNVQLVSVSTDMNNLSLTMTSGYCTDFVGEENVKHILEHLYNMSCLGFNDLDNIYKRAGKEYDPDIPF